MRGLSLLTPILILALFWTTDSTPRKQCRSHGCGTLAQNGYCNDTNFSWKDRKVTCAVECGFCGMTDPDGCRDYDGPERCDAFKRLGYCDTITPMGVEYHCAQTCGYCEHPN